MDPRLDRRLTVRALHQGQPVEARLEVPTAGYELPLIPSPGRRERWTEADHHSAISTVLAGVIDTVGGRRPGRAEFRGFVAHAESLRSLLEARRSLYEEIRDEGRVMLGCGHCGAEHETVLVVLAIGLDPNPWPVADPDGEPVAPSLSTLFPVGVRPPGAVTARSARLVLPSARLDMTRPFSEAVLGLPLTPERDADAWRRWGREDKPFDPERPHWSWGFPGFRAILRAALVLERLDQLRELAPEVIEQLPVTDFLFLDAVHHFVRCVDVREPERITVTCASCRGRFLLVL